MGDLSMGLNVWDGQKCQTLVFGPQVPRVGRVSAVYHTRRPYGALGRIAGPGEGVVRYSGKESRQVLPVPGQSTGLFKSDQSGKSSRMWNSHIWVAGAGGLSRLQGDRFQTLDRRHGLPDDDLYYALIDDTGAFWRADSVGIFRVTAPLKSTAC